ncbi:MAG TPA: hypothetical protein DCW94_02305 [Porticoccaceae bacterium]|nr:hypothetical protein [Porticoccaceae bacterium]
MNRNLSKLLQSLAGAVVLSMASLSMAATYDYDFDADENERGGATLSFGGDLTVHGGLLVDGAQPSVVAAYAYLDSGPKAGLGVCKSLRSTEGDNGNWCAPASDDNMQQNEVLGFVFDAAKKISTVGLHGGHTDLADGTDILIWTDSATDGGFKLLSTLAGKITLNFELANMAIFGSMSTFYSNYMEKYHDIGTTSANKLYVAGINEVPIPAAVWLFGSALLGLTGLRRRKVAV